MGCSLRFKNNLQVAKKVCQHHSISYNISNIDHSIFKLYRFQGLFNFKVSTMLKLLEVYIQGVQQALLLLLFFKHIKVLQIELLFILII